MNFKSLAMNDLLKLYNFFQECIIEEIIVDNENLNFSLIFNYIWNSNGTIRSNIEKLLLIRIDFKRFQSLNIINNFTHDQLKHKNWSYNEISCIQLIEEPKVYEGGLTFYRAKVLWENDLRLIDVIFSDLQITIV